MSVLLLFIDGVGLGEGSPRNPFYLLTLPGIESLLEGNKLTRDLGLYETSELVFIPTDARLGVEGLPQSATGQATIFTGRNAAKFLGHHQSGFPMKRLREWLKKDNIYIQIKKSGKSAIFANAYTEEYFARPATQRGWMSVTTIAMLSAELYVNMKQDLTYNRAVFHDLTREGLREFAPDVPMVTPEEAARHLLDLTQYYDLTSHEFFLTDVAGHKQDLSFTKNILERYDRFLNYLVKNKPDDLTIILTSDHGNCEDLHEKQHTFNKVPTFVIGRGKDIIKNKIQSLTDIAPAILTLLEKG